MNEVVLPHTENTPRLANSGLIDDLARKIVGRQLEAPALLLLETHRPISTILFASTLAFEPLGTLLFSRRPFEVLRAVLEDPAGVDLLISRIESLRDERDRTMGA